MYLIEFFVIVNLLKSVDILKHAGARNEKGEPIIKDCFGSPLTARYVPLKADIVTEVYGFKVLTAIF